jgi:hypothetical protein
MIEPKGIPQEYVNIRQVWLKQIDRCAEAISHRYMKDVHDQYSERSGLETVVESVVALETLLVDYGEAAVKHLTSMVCFLIVSLRVLVMLR